ncbi:MAG: Ldh family oxidoreductase, partial [Nocardiopsaceae bacterium]|jgi:(2R)-3-sulfolactate dehydrogenase (NADP+)|nr:Ldh family oxidoreductase [Nocardiopsaceae bacterium]
MPPPGGRHAVVSTSPVAAGIPSRPRPAIVDLATSAVSRGRIAALAQRGEPIPPGWAVTASGEPTTDPQAAIEGMLAPLGGPKGFALAFLVEALTGGLVGPVLSTQVADMLTASDAARPQQIAHLVIALAPSRLGVDGGSAARDRLDLLAARVAAAGGRAPGSRRALPDEIDEQARLPVSRQTQQQITTWARRLRVPVPDG